MKVLVTGAGGFVGQAVTTQLLRAGYTVRALVRRPENIFTADPNLEWTLGDIRNKDAVRRAVDGVEIIVHLAAAKSDEEESFAINVTGTRNLIEAALENHSKRFVLLSTISAKFPRRGVYGETKRQAEELVQESGILSVILRASVIYGDLQEGVMNSIARYARLPIIPVIGSGKATLWPIHVGDVAVAIEKTASQSLEKKSSLYDLGGPEEISLNDLTRTLAREVGDKSNPRLIHIPLWAAFAIARLSAFAGSSLLTTSNVLGAAQYMPVETGTFDREYDFHPRPLRQGIREMLRKESRHLSEPYVIMRYICGMEPSDYYIHLYTEALESCGVRSHHIPPYLLTQWRLGALDAITRINNPHGTFQQKLLIAATVYECSPLSAHLLRQQSCPQVLMTLMRSSIATASLFVFGLLLWCVSRTARHV